MGIDPASLMIAAQVAGTVISAVGSIAQGNAQAGADRYQAQVAQNNATIARQNADYAMKAGEARTTAEALKGRQQMGRLKAGIAAGGVDVNTGSAVGVLEGQAEVNQLDAMTVRSNAAREAYGYQTQATTFDAQSQLYKSEASDAENAGYLGAFTGLLSGAGNIGSNWSRWGTVAGGAGGGAAPDISINPSIYNPYG